MQFLSTIPFGTILGLISGVLFLAAVIVQSVKIINKMPPQDRNDWLHRALAVALSLENVTAQQGGVPSANLGSVLKNVNVYLKLHGLPSGVTQQQVTLLLAELKPQLEATIK